MGTDWIILLINDIGTHLKGQGNWEVQPVVHTATNALHLVRQRAVLRSIG